MELIFVFKQMKHYKNNKKSMFENINNTILSIIMK